VFCIASLWVMPSEFRPTETELLKYTIMSPSCKDFKNVQCNVSEISFPRKIKETLAKQCHSITRSGGHYKKKHKKTFFYICEFNRPTTIRYDTIRYDSGYLTCSNVLYNRSGGCRQAPTTVSRVRRRLTKCSRPLLFRTGRQRHVSQAECNGS